MSVENASMPNLEMNSAELFLQLGEHLRESFWVTDSATQRLLYLSPGFWGPLRDGILAETWSFLDFVHPDDRERMATLADRDHVNEEFRVIRDDGSIRWLRTRGTTINNEAGKPHRMVGLSEDITERKQAEAASRQNEEVLSTFVDAMPDLLMLARADGVITHFRGDVSVLVANTSAIVGATPRDNLPEQSAEEVLGCIQRAASGEEKNPRCEYALVDDGLTRYYEARFARCSDGQVLIVVRDIGERKRVQESLRQSEMRFRTLAETSFEGVAIFEKGRINAANKTFANFFGSTGETIVGQRILRMIAPSWRRFAIDQAFWGTDGSYEAQGLRQDGSTFWMEFRVQNIPYENHTVQVATVRDITERRHNEELRRQFIERIIAAQEDERRRIARELHDTMAQSLTSLLVGLRALADVVNEPQAVQTIQGLRQLTASTIEEAQRLARGLRPSVLDDMGFLPAMERLVDDARQAHGFAVDLHISGLDQTQRLTPTLETALYRILQEGITNVARHAEATCVDLLIERHGNMVRAVVEDNGRGFERGSVNCTSGLGLLGIKERAALLHGQALIDSSPGSGTTLTITLPVTYA